MFTFDLAAELEGTGVEVVALHPASMMDTNMVLSRGARARSSVDEGTEAVMNLIVSDQVENGRYYNGLQPARAHEQAYDTSVRDRLRRVAEELTGATSRF
jgi:NAD(P)-dependent dehydrogenase (short-subunit alcohol dehydrogenase family)